MLRTLVPKARGLPEVLHLQESTCTAVLFGSKLCALLGRELSPGFRSSVPQEGLGSFLLSSSPENM